MKLFRKKTNTTVTIIDSALIDETSVSYEYSVFTIIIQNYHKYIWSLNKSTCTAIEEAKEKYIQSMRDRILGANNDKILLVMDLDNIEEADDTVLNIFNTYKSVKIYAKKTSFLKSYYLETNFPNSVVHYIDDPNNLVAALRVLGVKCKAKIQ